MPDTRAMIHRACSCSRIQKQVYAVYLGDWTGTSNQNRITQLNQFISDFLSSSYMDVLSQYGIGTSGNFVNSVIISDVSNTLVDADFQTVLQNAMQLLDAGIGLFEHDLGKCAGPLFIAALQFFVMYRLYRSMRITPQTKRG